MDAVVVTHDSAADLRRFIASDATTSAFDRIVVVDNASRDESRDLARAAGFDLIALPRNVGYGTAANAGARHARGPVFAVMNPDVSFADPEDAAALHEHFADAAVGVVGPALVLPHGGLQDSARRVPTIPDLVVRRLLHRTPDAARANGHAVDVEWAVGACMLLRRSAFEAIGGFDERFFLYFEDVDLCLRMARAGYVVRYDPRVRVRHQYGAASRKSLVGFEGRAHVRSAVRFYLDHPQFALPRRG